MLAHSTFTNQFIKNMIIYRGILMITHIITTSLLEYLIKMWRTVINCLRRLWKFLPRELLHRVILIIRIKIKREKSCNIVGTPMKTEEWWLSEVMKLLTLMEPLQQSMEVDSPNNNITVFCKGRFNSQVLDIVRTIQIGQRPPTIQECKIIWVIQMEPIGDGKTRAQLKTTRNQRRKTQGCPKTSKKTWTLLRNPAFHKFSSNRRLIFSN